jgi:F-type H+-transporting ATPase subunit delta
MADNETIARPYAQAVFELAHEAGELTAWSVSLEAAGALLTDGRVVAFLGDPHFSDAERLDFLTGLMAKGGAKLFSGSDRRGTNFLKLLIEYDRLAAMPEIATHFEALKDDVENSVDVVVTSANPLDKNQLEAMTGALRARLGRTVNIATEINENLIGGAVIKAGDVVIDGSLRARLDGLATALIK